MTCIQGKRCSHCRTPFYFVASGSSPYEDDDSYSPHDRYCRVCWEAVKTVLKTVPVKYRQVIRDVGKTDYSSVTLEDVLRWEAEKEPTLFSRVGMPLFDLKNPSNINNVRFVRALDGPFEGTQFLASTWSKSPDYNIRVEFWEENSGAVEPMENEPCNTTTDKGSPVDLIPLLTRSIMPLFAKDQSLERARVMASEDEAVFAALEKTGLP